MSQPEFLEIEKIGNDIEILEQNVSKLTDICNELQTLKENQLKDKKCVKCEEQATKCVDCGRAVNPPIYIYICDKYPSCQCKQLNIIKNEIYND